MLCKADLLTEVVGEFPELQGLMGKYYALAQGEDASVAAASEDHYKPAGPADRVPTDPVSVAVALADKIAILSGFWAISELPTGSKDPFALRRAALGCIRIIQENGLRIALGGAIGARATHWYSTLASRLHNFTPEQAEHAANAAKLDLLNFFADRLKVQLREQGARHDLVDAVFALEGQDDLLMIVRRVEALGKFLDTDDGKNLLAGVKRASNILRIEEKKDGVEYNAGAGRKALQAGRGEGARRRHRASQGRSRQGGRQGRFRRRHDRDGEAAPACRCVLRQGHRQRGGRRRTPRTCAPTGCGCSTKFAKRRARWRISPKSKAETPLSAVLCPALCRAPTRLFLPQSSSAGAPRAGY